MIRVLVVEDDFRVAQVHAAFAERVPGFTVVGTASTAEEARGKIRDREPDLVLLDHYLPDSSGLALLAELTVDTIMLTAASDAASVRAAFAAGALNYLVKPFTAEQLGERLSAYARYRRHLSSLGRSVTQEEIDRALRLLHEGNRPPAPKGQSPVTARLVADALKAAEGPCSAAEIAARLGIARATAQRYLAGLAQEGRATMTLRYGATGRPEHRYQWAAGA
ncbi:response regulator [Gandjariella thermophila]|uniref:Transcriptional regulatory protein n=1 Tax=Gandjariella thermophila TaxID=1931992 RepID=A0A4D4J8T6_9PSEU|nr:response regulator [Gandjariella thermophila]GDY31944.1 transcriptional regulatory protein [Gandjariella thermophila]